jgi:parallel beta-helix repeat protein
MFRRTTPVIALLCLSATAVFAGSLTPPPGTPAPTMKTLTQVEPRVDLHDPQAPGVNRNDPGNEIIITTPGSYYLSSDLAVGKADGIRVDASDVTIDLQGFRIHRTTSPGTGHGVRIVGAHDAAIRNGSIRGFAYGIRAAQDSNGCRVEKVAVSSCSFAGITAEGSGSIIESCQAHLINGDHGIGTNRGSTISNCTVSSCTVTGSGISAGSGSVVNSCVVEWGIVGNGFYGASASFLNCSAANLTVTALVNCGGFRLEHCAVTNCSATFISSTSGNLTIGSGFVTDYSQLSGCKATRNSGCGFDVWESVITQCLSVGNGTKGDGYGVFGQNGIAVIDSVIIGNRNYGIWLADGGNVTNCTVRNTVGSPGLGIGIRVGDYSTLSGCTVSDNPGDGIQFVNYCTILNNTAVNNGIDPFFDGIHSLGSNNRIDGNTASGNKSAGIRSSASDVVVRNTARGNGTNYIPASGANFGPLGSPATATSPWANF